MDRGKLVYGGLTLVGLITLGAGLLIPIVGSNTTKNAQQSATKAQYANYVTALQMFKGEYGYFPDIFEGRSQVNISVYPDSEKFIEAISGRTANGEETRAHGNRRAIRFHSFTDRELTTANGLGYRQIVDRFGNTNIVICVDHDSDGYIELMDEGELKKIRVTVTAYSIPPEGEEAIKLWD